jgi:hypothetical protein
MAARARSSVDPSRPQPKSDAYTGMLGISLGALVIGCALLYFDYSRYPSTAPPKPQKAQSVSLEQEQPRSKSNP